MPPQPSPRGPEVLSRWAAAWTQILAAGWLAEARQAPLPPGRWRSSRGATGAGCHSRDRERGWLWGGRADTETQRAQQHGPFQVGSDAVAACLLANAGSCGFLDLALEQNWHLKKPKCVPHPPRSKNSVELTGQVRQGAHSPLRGQAAGTWDPEPGWTPSQCWVFSCAGAALGTERVTKRKQPRSARLKKPHRNQIRVERCRNAGGLRHGDLTDGRCAGRGRRPGLATPRRLCGSQPHRLGCAHSWR